MALRIEDYALIGDCKTAAFGSARDGSIDLGCAGRGLISARMLCRPCLGNS